MVLPELKPESWVRHLPQFFCPLLNFAFKISDHSFLKSLDLTAQLESLRSVADHVAGFVNASGAVPVVRLHDILNRVREVALHGVHHGAVIALAAAQVYSNHDLWLLPHEALVTRYPVDYERLVEEFSDATNSVTFISQADDIIAKVFSGP